MIDSSNISIRNELVKHAASAYVQSTAILANRDQEWFSTLWERIRDHYLAMQLESCWYIYVRTPLSELFRPMFQFLDYVVNGVTRLLSGRSLE
ncbi:hypothetical protein Leryth_026342 [Lithospermum erythrorhizon]|nr:hypothetical protein Leryth_026342 [Lithospermum erythrorhizon]